MAWIRIIGPDEAEGLLAQLYREARARAGKVFQVLRVQSLRPRALRGSDRHAPLGRDELQRGDSVPRWLGPAVPGPRGVG